MVPGDHGIELLVKRIAHKIARNLPPSVQIEDLFQSGMAGWIIAKRKYDETIPVPFNKFASIYIYGCILDGLRAGSWVPRDLSKSRRAVEQAKNNLLEQHIYFPSAAQIAEQLKIPLTKYHKISYELLGMYPDSLDDDMDVPDETNIDFEVEQVFKWQKLEAAIDALPVLPRLIVRMHYNEEIPVAEIARKLNIEEYPARKILKDTLIDLKIAMRDWLPDEAFEVKEYI